MQLHAGVRIRSFEVVAPIGAGGMGAVYRARDAKLGREVAIKFLQEELSGDREYLHRFEREARAASSLNHPNIITIFEIGEYEGAPFIAMELVDGTSLREVLRKGPLGVRKLLDVAAQVADGLAAAHERGIVHRDLKPDNVMVTVDGRVKILDFGLARITREAAPDDSTSEISSVRTPEGRIVGTASYVSPEQASGARHVDYRSDQFSFGSLVYELATGHRAFARPSTVETLAAIVRDEPEPVQRINPKLPPPLVWIIERCLAKDPAGRYASTRDLASELRTLRDRLPETSPGRLRRPLTPRKRMTIATISVAVLVTAAAIIGTSGRFRAAAPALPNRKYLAVLPFKDLSGRPDGQLFSQGFGDAVSARLAKYSGIQVIPPASTAPLIAKKATFKRIAQELGATLLLDASVQRTADKLRVSCHILDPATGAERAGDIVSGPVHDVWSVQDEVADTVARDLGIEQRPGPSAHTGLDTAEEQDLYVRALGSLERSDDVDQVNAAINVLRELVETASDSPLVHAALGRAYRAMYIRTNEKEWAEKAIRACERARSLDPGSADVLLTLGEVQELSGDVPAAIATFRKTISIRPDNTEALLELAGALKRNRDLAGAEQTYQRAVALRPTWWKVHNELGLLYLGEHRYDAAEREFRSVIRLNPQTSFGFLNVSVVYINEGRLKDAIAVLETAKSFGIAGAYSNLGYCYYFLGDFDRAAASYRKAIEISGAVGARWKSLADACAWSTTCRDEVATDYAKAIELFRRDLAVDPKSAGAHGRLAVCLAKTSRPKDAAEHMRIALDLDPSNPDRMYEAARVCNAAGETDDAVAWLQKAIAAGAPTYQIEQDPEFTAIRSAALDRNRPVRATRTG